VDYTSLGNTGLNVSVAGLGCGGNSCLGLGSGRSEAECVALVRAALDVGVTYFDTAENYGTEAVLGQALAGLDRDSFVLSTKTQIVRAGTRKTPAEVVACLDGSLKRLRLSYVDVFMLHAVKPADYQYARDIIAPALVAEQGKGKFAHLGITEMPSNDPHQDMLKCAVQDPCWNVMMFAFHMLNQGARHNVLPHTMANGIGTLMMFVVRNIFSRPGVLQSAMRDLAESGQVFGALAERDNPLDFLLHDDGAETLTDAAYRFARHEPGTDVVLFGTGSVEHLHSNVASILRPALPDTDRDRLSELFGCLTGIGLALPDRVKS
jgi:aryl-alcohol dehydrogenase-like predicted oxidoreductase